MQMWILSIAINVWDGCGISEHEFNFYANNEDSFYCIDCVEELEINTVGSNDFCRSCFRKFSYPSFITNDEFCLTL